ncbi:MAG: protein arginine kinase [Phycisphaerales bacterium]|nr:protein arginine kinase [Phycisphaerales bacterium]
MNAPIDTIPEHDVVLTTRARLARNLSDQPFLNRASDLQCAHVVRTTQRVMLDVPITDQMVWMDLDELTPLDRSLLVERHLISQNHAESSLHRGVAISGNEQLSIMVNEEDHLRIQVLKSGARLQEAYQELMRVDTILEQHLDFAFHDQWGYLAVCPTNVGTGIRFSVMVHLPALRIANELGKVRRAAKELHLAVRGYYGEGSESTGNIYQVSNQVTLGRSEEDLLEEFATRIIPGLIDYERSAREVLVRSNATLLDDRVHRADSVLRSARLLKLDEAMKLLSRVRLGAALGRLDVPLEAIDQLFVQVQPAHLSQEAGTTLTESDVQSLRASLVRETLSA